MPSATTLFVRGASLGSSAQARLMWKKSEVAGDGDGQREFSARSAGDDCQGLPFRRVD